MDEDLKLPEDGEINLDLDDVPEGDAVLPQTDGDDAAAADFNLDEFLAENAVEEPSEKDLNLLGDDDVNLDGLFADDAPVSSELPQEEPVPGIEETTPELAAPEVEPEIEEEPEIEAEPEPVIEPVLETESELEPEPDVEPETEETTGWLAQDEETPSEENAFGEEEVSVPAEEEIEEPSKGWAFDGLEDAPATEDAAFEEIAPEDAVSEDNFYEQADNYSATVQGDVSETGYDMVSEPNFVKWYSGDSSEEMFVLDKNSASEVLQGDEVRKVIHINVGYDTYGWQVRFADNTVMNLRDVREYQLRNGSLPAADGMVIYGEMQTQFYGIEKITIYESVRYFTYG